VDETANDEGEACRKREREGKRRICSSLGRNRKDAIGAKHLHVFSIRLRDPLEYLVRSPSSTSLPLRQSRFLSFFVPLSLSLPNTTTPLPSACYVRARKLKPAGLPAPFVRYFSSGTLARQSYSPVASPTPLPVSFLQSGRVIPPVPPVFLRLRFRTPSTSRQIGKCAPVRIHERDARAASRGSIRV